MYYLNISEKRHLFGKKEKVKNYLFEIIIIKINTIIDKKAKNKEVKSTILSYL